MKKIFIILSFLFVLVSANAQVPTDPTDLQNKINAWIITNGNKQITATQVHDLLTGINNLMLKYSVNNAYRINDTLFLTGPNLSTIKVTMSAGSGGDETDPTVPLVVKAITSTNISTWNSKQAALTPGSTIDITSNVITAKSTLPLWNANQLQGHAVSSANPTNGQAYIWNSSTNQLEPSTIAGGEPVITASNTIKQYWNGYKQFVALNTDSIIEGSTNKFYTDTRARNAITITTIGTTGPATYTAGNFNIPQYTGINLGSSDLTSSGDRNFNSASHRLIFYGVADPTWSIKGAFSGNAGVYTIVDTPKDIQITFSQSPSSGAGYKQGMEIDSWGVRNGGPGHSSPYSTLLMDSGRTWLIDPFNYILMMPSTSGQPGITFSGAGGNYWMYSLIQTNDSGTYKPLAANNLGQIVQLDHWPGSSGGGGNPFADNNPLVKNNSDNTKRVIIGAGNVTTGTTRTLQSPDASGTIVLNDNTATLTNKTIAAGSNTISGLTNSNLSGSAAISNANLANSAITINGSSTSLGGSVTVTDANLSTSNVTTNNATTSKHGFVPILPNDATKFYDGTGAYSVPVGTDHPNSRPTSTVSTATTFSIAAGDVIDYIWVDPASAETIQVGTTSTGSDIIPSTALLASSTNNFLVGYRATASTTLYFQGISSSTVITLIKRQ